jgi:purine-binding chemotaxis protein CheW
MQPANNQGVSQRNDLNKDGEDAEGKGRYLVFDLGGERYACLIVQVREVMKVPALKPVPYMQPSFTGILNLRGQMVGVVDLRIRFQIPIVPGKPGIILVMDLGDTLLGAHVDEVVAVANLSTNDIRKGFSVETSTAIEFLEGIAEINGRLVNIVDLSRILSSQELRNVRSLVSAS